MDVNHPFQGHALNAVDAKGRVSVPAPFRELIATRCRAYAPGDISIKDNELGLAIHPNFDRLRAYDAIGTRQLSSALRESIADIGPSDRMEALAERGSATIGGTSAVSFDSAGRLVIPPMLREFAGIGEHALFWGNVDFFEIWDPARAREAFEGDRLKSSILAYLLRERGLPA